MADAAWGQVAREPRAERLAARLHRAQLARLVGARVARAVVLAEARVADDRTNNSLIRIVVVRKAPKRSLSFLRLALTYENKNPA